MVFCSLSCENETFFKARPLAQKPGSEVATPHTSGMAVPEAEVQVLESRLATHALYDDENKRLLEDLLTGNEELRKQNAALEMENQRLQHTLDLDSRRHKEVNKTEHFSDMYDWIVNIQLLSDVSNEVGARAFPATPAPPPLVSSAVVPRGVVRRRLAGVAHRIFRDLPAGARLDVAGAPALRQGLVDERRQGQARGDARRRLSHRRLTHPRGSSPAADRRPSAGAVLSWRCSAYTTRARRLCSTT